jgi:transcription initiation protein SPT3
MPDSKETNAKAFSKMMYVSGETAEPSPETTGMVEEIVRQQVIEMVNAASIHASPSPPCRKG